MEQEKPICFLDTGVVIALSRIHEATNKKVDRDQIIDELMRSNPCNIGEKQAQSLLSLYYKFQNDEIQFVICPLVYKEALEDKQNKKDSHYRRSYTFIKDCCSLAVPKQDFTEFAYKTALLADRLKHTSTLGEDWKEYTLSNGVKVSVDVNIEDRLLYAQTVIMAYEGRLSYDLVSITQMFNAMDREANSSIEKDRTLKQNMEELNSNSKELESDPTLFASVFNKEDLFKTVSDNLDTYLVNVNSEDFGTKDGYNKDLKTHIGYEKKVSAFDEIMAITTQFLNDYYAETKSEVFYNPEEKAYTRNPYNMSVEEMQHTLDYVPEDENSQDSTGLVPEEEMQEF